MRIAQVSPLFESVPPKMYGGTERIVSYLTEELVNRGHEVTLFASDDSDTKAKLVSPGCRALRLNKHNDPNAYHLVMLEALQKQIDNFDIIHFHTDYLHYSLARRSKTAHLTTLHGRLDIPELHPLFNEFSEIPFISISQSQRKPFPNANWKGTIYHGIPESLYSPSELPGKYLGFLGRFSPEKRAERAIEISIKSGIPLKLAGKIDVINKDYFNEIIKPHFSHPLIEYIGEINDREKNEFLGNAMALLFPIDWPEPFGLVMIEAMACGTPVIAWNSGSVSEIIEPNINGFIVHSETEALEALSNLHKLNRNKVRESFSKRFSVNRMTNDYVKVYDKVINDC